MCTTLEHLPRGHYFKLPFGLVGTRSTAEVTINGEIQVSSQVATVSHSFYKQHLYLPTIALVVPNNPEVILAGQTIVVAGFALANNILNEKTVVVQHPLSSGLPGGLVVEGLLD